MVCSVTVDFLSSEFFTPTSFGVGEINVVALPSTCKIPDVESIVKTVNPFYYHLVSQNEIRFYQTRSSVFPYPTTPWFLLF